jgi:hypothetical protein
MSSFTITAVATRPGEVGKREFVTTYKIVPFVSAPDAPLETLASFVVEDGQPAAQRA